MKMLSCIIMYRNYLDIYFDCNISEFLKLVCFINEVLVLNKIFLGNRQ